MEPSSLTFTIHCHWAIQPFNVLTMYNQELSKHWEFEINRIHIRF